MAISKGTALSLIAMMLKIYATVHVMLTGLAIGLPLHAVDTLRGDLEAYDTNPNDVVRCAALTRHPLERTNHMLQHLHLECGTRERICLWTVAIGVVRIADSRPTLCAHCACTNTWFDAVEVQPHCTEWLFTHRVGRLN